MLRLGMKIYWNTTYTAGSRRGVINETIPERLTLCVSSSIIIDQYINKGKVKTIKFLGFEILSREVRPLKQLRLILHESLIKPKYSLDQSTVPEGQIVCYL